MAGEVNSDTARRTEIINIGCAQIGFFVKRNAGFLASVTGNDVGCIFVIIVVYDVFGAVVGKESVLASHIVVEVGVFVLADMVGREVCEYAYLEFDAIYSCHLESLRGDLHNECLDACIDHFSHVIMEIDALGGGIYR